MRSLSELCAALAAADREVNDNDQTAAVVQLPAAFDASVMSDTGRPLGGAPASQAHLQSSPIIPLPFGTVKDAGIEDDAIRGRAIHAETVLPDRIEALAGDQLAFLGMQAVCDIFRTCCFVAVR
jgi:hypothetical protein